MIAHGLASLTREEILDRLVAAESAIRDLVEEAAHVTSDPDERRLFERLAGREEASLGELKTEMERLEAETFVQKAMDV
ncbi:MAG: hypothetical protein ACHQKZ_10280 [Solirubrobacterales bacterium]|jgi:hypothetical protein